MILVDTSVLIEYLKGNTNASVVKFENILSDETSFGISNYVYQEILQGAANKKEFETLSVYLGGLIFYDLRNGKKSFSDAVKIYFTCRKKGITIRSTIDLLIAQIAIENNLFLLHNDRDFNKISEVFPELKLY